MSEIGQSDRQNAFKEPFWIGGIGLGVLQHSIVTGIDRIADADILDLAAELPAFEGLQCPSDSIARRAFGPSAAKTHNQLILLMSNEAKLFFGWFRFKTWIQRKCLSAGSVEGILAWVTFPSSDSG
jgi:hypothetical protein